MAHPLWKSVAVSSNVNIELLYDRAILFLDVYQKEMKICPYRNVPKCYYYGTAEGLCLSLLPRYLG